MKIGKLNQMPFAKLARKAMYLLAFAVFGAQAATVAKVGDAEYETLEAAIAAAEPVDGVVTYEICGKAEVSATGWISVLKSGLANVTKVAFVGTTKDAEICITEGVAILADQLYDIDVSFKNLKLSKQNPTWANDYGHSTNYFTTWLRNTNAAENTVTYENCTFPNGVCNNQYGKTVYTNCTFANGTTGFYNLWVYGGVVEMDGGTFTGTRGMKVYTEGTPATAPSVEVKGTTFTALTEKPAIIVSKAATVTLAKVSVKDCEKGFFLKDIEGSTDDQKVTISANGEKISGDFAITAEKSAESAKTEFNITGGTFTAAVSSDYCADGFTVTATTDADGNTVYGVAEKAEAVNYVTLELSFGANVAEEDVAAAKALYTQKKYETCKAANEAYMALFGVTWGKGYLDVTDNAAPLYKYAGKSGSVSEVRFYIHGTLAGFTSLESSRNQIDCTVGGNHQIFRTSYSIIGVDGADGSKAKLTDGNVQAYVAGGYASMFTASGKLTIDNIEFTSTTSTTVGASAARATEGDTENEVASAEMEIKNCTFRGRLYVYDNFENLGKMTYRIQNCVFDGSDYSGDSNAYAIFAQCKGGNNLVIKDNEISGFARGINIDNANVHATIEKNTISVTDSGRSCIQLSSLATADIIGNTLKLTGGNAITLHEKLLTLGEVPQVSISDNTVTGTGYLIYDDAAANGKAFTSDNLKLTYATDNKVAETVSTTEGVKGSTVSGTSTAVNNEIQHYAATIGTRGYATLDEALADVAEGKPLTWVSETAWPVATPVYYNGKFYEAQAGFMAKGALEVAIDAANEANADEVAKIYVRPGFDANELVLQAHQPMKTSLAIYGNDAKLAQNWEPCVEYPGTSGDSGAHQLTKDVSLAIYNLHNGAGFWGRRVTDYTVDLKLSGCQNAYEVMFYGDANTSVKGKTNISVADCTFDAADRTDHNVIVTIGAGTVEVSGTTFTAANINVKNVDGGDNKITVKGCTFKDTVAGNQNIRVRSYLEESKVELVVDDVTFEGNSTQNIEIGDNKAEGKGYVSYTITKTEGTLNVYKQGATTAETTGLLASAEPYTGSNVAEKVVDFATFVAALEAADYTFDGSTHKLAQDGKLTVKWSPESGCYDTREGHDCTVENVKATANTPKRVNNGLTQFQLFEGESHAVSVKNVAFVYEPVAFTVCENSNWKGTFTAEQAPAGQIYLMNTGDVTFEGCTFEKVVLTSFNCTGTSTVKGCSFKNVYNNYAVKDIRGTKVSVTGCTFEDCGAAVMVSATTGNAKVDAVTISGNTFTNVDVAGTAPDTKVGTRGLIQIASSGDYSETAFDFSDNTAEACGPVMRQLNTTVSFDTTDKAALDALVSENGCATLYTSDTFDPRTLGYATSGTAEALPAAPDMSGEVVNVTAAQAQYVLDGAYGSIDGKTINFTESIDATLVLGRAAKYDGSKTVYRHGGHGKEALSYADFIAYKNQSGWTEYCYYERTVENVTFTANEGVTVKGFTAEGGAHVYGTENSPVYDYVRDTGVWCRDTNNGYYKRAILKNITFKKLTFTAKVDLSTSEATTVYEGFTFTGCTFEIGSTASGNQAIRYYNEHANDNVKNLVVDDCTFKNCFQGVYTANTKNVTVKDSTFDTTGHNAIAVQDNPGAFDHGEVVITGNTFKNIGDRIIRFNNVGDGTTITITGNTADGNSGKLDKATGKREIVAATTLPENAAESVKASNNKWGANTVVAGVFIDDYATKLGTEACPYSREQFATMTRADYIAAQKRLDGTLYVNVGDYAYDTHGVLGNGVRDDTTGQTPDHSKLNAYGENGYLGEKNDGANGHAVVFLGGTVTSGVTGYTSIDNIGTSLLLAVPAYTKVTFKKTTFKNVLSFDYQLYTVPWSQLGGLTFDGCTFDGIIVGALASQELAFTGCAFNDYKNTAGANNSNPTWICPAYGNWSKGDNEGQGEGFRSLTKITFENNTVTSTRPVKFERIAQWEMATTVTATGNTFDITPQGGDTSTKNVGLYFGANAKFDLVIDENTKGGDTAALYTAVYSAPNGGNYAGLPAGSTVKNKAGEEATSDDALVWKTTNTLTLKTTEEVASVTNAKGVSVNFATLAEAIAAAADGETVKLLMDTTENVTIGKSITLDLNGKTLTGTGAASAATVAIAKDVTVVVKNGTVLGTDNSYYTIQNNGTATLEGVTATAGNTGSSMLDNWGTLTINSGTYTGGLNVVKSEEGSTLTITGGTFTLTDTKGSAYTAVILTYGDTTISGGEFIQSVKTPKKWAHPIVVMTGLVEGYPAVTKVTGGTFKNNATESIFHGLGKATSANFEVSGGTFNKKISDGFCADGFIPTKNADGTYGVKKGSYVAQIGSTGYETLEAALAAADAGATVKMLANVVLTEKQTIAKALVLDLNGKTISSTVDQFIVIAKGGDLTINDATGEGRIENTATDFWGGTIVMTGGVLTLNGGTLAANTATGAYSPVIEAKNESTATINVAGGRIEANRTGSVNAIQLGQNADATLNVTGGMIVGGNIGVYSYQCTGTDHIGNKINVSGGEIIGKSGNAVYATSKTGITVSGGTLTPGGTAAALAIGGRSCTVTVGREGGTVDDVTIPSIDFKPSFSANEATVNLLSGRVLKFLGWDNMKVESVSQGKGKLLVGTDITASLPGSDLLCQKDAASGLYEIVALTVENAAAVVTHDGVETSYHTVEQARKAVTDGDTLTLKVDHTGALALSAKNVTVDLGGHTLTYSGTGEGAALQVNQSADADNTVTVGNGTIKATGQNNACIRATSGTVAQTLTLVLGNDLTFEVGNNNRSGKVVLGKGARTASSCVAVNNGGLLVTEGEKQWIYGETETAFTHANGSEVMLLNEWYCTDTEGAVKVPETCAFASAKLNLGGHTIKHHGVGPAIVMSDAAKPDEGTVAKTLEISNGTIETPCHGAAVCGSNKSLTLDGVTLKTTGDSTLGIYANGTTSGNAVTLKNESAVVSEKGTGIYFPGAGTLTVEDSNVTGGVSGIEVRAGVLNVSGTSVIESTAAAFNFANGDNGITTTGAAVAAVKHTVGYDLAVTITGGTFKGPRGFYANDPNEATGGKVTVSISGGAFSTDVEKDYLADGCKTVQKTIDGTPYYVVGPAVTQIEVSLGDVKKVLPFADAWLTKNIGADASGWTTEALEAKAANELKKWQCYLFGLDPNDATAKIVATAKQGTVESIPLTVANADAATSPLVTGGYVTVTYVLMGSDGGTAWTEVVTSGKPVTSDKPNGLAIPLTDTTYKFYRVDVKVTSAEGN